MNAETTVKAKLAFERVSSSHGVIIRHYHSDNGLFDTKAFKASISNRPFHSAGSMPIIKTEKQKTELKGCHDGRPNCSSSCRPSMARSNRCILMASGY
jgi:hypothetical protein